MLETLGDDVTPCYSSFEYTEMFLRSANQSTDLENVTSRHHAWWYNTRTKSQGGLRLTEQGYTYIHGVLEFEFLQFDYISILVTSKLILMLDQTIRVPWCHRGDAVGTVMVMKSEISSEIALHENIIRFVTQKYDRLKNR